MVCGVCKKNFTKSSDVADYYNKGETLVSPNKIDS
jgi:hypothetical protein